MMKKVILSLIIILFICGVSSSALCQVYVVEFDDLIINPVSARFLIGAISEAEEARAECLVIKMNTPGGLQKSMESMYMAILNSRVPIVVYVAPKGAHATSAGVFVALSANIIAMSPSTDIGSAYPVAMGGGQMDEGVKNKIVGRTVAEAEKLAEKGGRLLFTVGSEYQADLDDEKIPEGLRQELESNGISLSSDAVISITEKGSDWRIKDGKIAHPIRKREDKLNIYRGRNVEWAGKSVSEGISSTENEALVENVIDLIANNLEELLERIDGWKVETETEAGDRVLHDLQTKDAEIRNIRMNLRERLLSLISDPNIAYILLMLGFYGLFFELSKPGSIFPGVVGAICIILAFFALQTLPINYAGILLMLVAIALFILEVKIASYGLLSLGGIVSMLIGSMMLIDRSVPFSDIFSISWRIILPVVLTTAAFFILGMILVIRTHMKKTTTGKEGLIGTMGVCKAEINPKGKIFIHGEYWNAISEEVIQPEEKVRVVEVDGLTLKVEKIV